jgi:phosphopantothenoylcysteine decarboxylase/phosphopantothenate--cysteine ligase
MVKKPFRDKNIILGVTGSIAAYKSAYLASKLAQSGANVETILTPAGIKFIAPLTFQSVTGHRAYTDEDLWGSEAHVLHVGLAHKADALVIAPITANTIAKLAQGIANDLLSLTALALGSGNNAPLLILAPAMDAGMYSHPATQKNLSILESRGAIIIGPESGHLASGLNARGRMTEPGDIYGHIRYHLSRGGSLSGKTIVVTAGATREPIDPVRFLTNRSTGKQGTAIAQAALDAGADVVFIAPKLSFPTPIGIKQVIITTAEEMKNAVLAECQQADALIMAAAVADFRPSERRSQKIKKSAEHPVMKVEPTSDILATLQQERNQTGCPKIVIGFAAETEKLLENAQTKLREKKLDFIVVNDVSTTDSGFEVDTNKITILDPAGQEVVYPLMTKVEVGEILIERLNKLLIHKQEKES